MTCHAPKLFSQDSTTETRGTLFHKLEKSIYCTLLLIIVAHGTYLAEQSIYLETGIIRFDFPVSDIRPKTGKGARIGVFTEKLQRIELHVQQTHLTRRKSYQKIESTLTDAKYRLAEVVNAVKVSERNTRNVFKDLLRTGSRLIARTIKNTPLNQSFEIGTNLILKSNNPSLVKKKELLYIKHELTHRTRVIEGAIKNIESHIKKDETL